MTNGENLTTLEGSLDDNLLDLRKKLSKESIHSNFRSKLIGGLNEKDVLKYIDLIGEKYQQVEQEMKKDMFDLLSSKNNLQKEFENFQTTALEEKQSLQGNLDKAQGELAICMDECEKLSLTIQSLNEKVNPEIAQLQKENLQLAEERIELERQLAVSRQEVEQIKADFDQEKNGLKSQIIDLETEVSASKESNRTVRELEQQIEFEKSVNEKQSLDLEMYKQQITSLEETITENKIMLEEQDKIRARAEEEIKLEKARVSSCKINGFKDEVFNIYQQLEALTEDQVKINKELQQQLEVEQMRANKAERSLAEMANWVSELKDKLYSEQNLFENQFKQMAERYGRFQSEINGCFINLQEQESLVFNGRTVRKTEAVSGV